MKLEYEVFVSLVFIFISTGCSSQAFLSAPTITATIDSIEDIDEFINSRYFPTETPIPSPTATPQTVPTNEVKEFSGYYVHWFEVSSFVPCSRGEMPSYGKGYWLDIDFDSDPEFFQRYYGFHCKSNIVGLLEAGSCEVVFVRFIGELSPPSFYSVSGEGYGHMEQYEREINVIELIEMASIEAHKCGTR